MAVVRWWCRVMAQASVLALVATGGASVHTTRSAQGEIVIHEVQFDPAPSGSESAFEWLELYNPASEPVSLAGWTLADNRAVDPLPEVDVAAGGYLVVAGERFGELFPSYDGALVTLGSIGNGLGNDGDRLRLFDAAGREVDAMSYGDDADALDPPAPDAPSGHSLEREPAGRDSDTAADWVVRESPSPGAAGSGEGAMPPPASPAPTGTQPSSPPSTPATPSPAATGASAPAGPLWVNEVLAAPAEIDWDGDGEATRADEFVELYNAGDTPIDLRGWRLDDIADGGSAEHVFDAGPRVPARGHLLLFQRDTGLVLNNGGDTVRLMRPDGQVVDAFAFERTGRDESWSRVTDGAAAWVDDLPPSPGAPNGAGRPAPSPAPGEGTPTPDDARPTTGPNVTRTPPATGGTETPAAPHPTGPAIFLPFLLSEVLYDDITGGNDADYEWVEIHNLSDQPASLRGWSVGDRRSWDVLGDVRVPPHGFVVVAATEALSRTLGGGTGRVGSAEIIVVADGRIGGGLGNTGDVVRLRGPTGTTVDQVGWGSASDAFDPHPAAPIGPPGVSLERIPPDRDRDTADDWWLQTTPSPGRAGDRPWHLDAPPVTINEVLPAPRHVDWDGDGGADHQDEWIELHNAASIPINLHGWQVQVGDPVRWTLRFPYMADLPASEDRPPAVRIPAHGFLWVPRRRTGLHLANEADTLRLLRPDGVEVDSVSWMASPGADRSWSRATDGDRDARWTPDYAVTPGGPNRPLAPGETRRADEARAGAEAARAAGWRARVGRADTGDPIMRLDLDDRHAWGRRTRVVVRGRVTAPPGLFGAREMSIGDGTGGIRLYLRRREHVFPPVTLGTGVAAIGRVSDYRGERQVTIDAPSDLWWEGPSGAVEPRSVTTSAIGEATEGQLVRVAGPVIGFGGPRITIDDGTGPARIVWRTSSGLRRPWLARGAWLEVTGIAGQSGSKAPWTDGYRVVPRFAADVVVGADPNHRSEASGGNALGRAATPVMRRRPRPLAPSRRRSGFGWPAHAAAPLLVR